MSEKQQTPVQKEEISYFGALITDSGLDSIRGFLNENGIETGPEQSNMHMTCEFYGFKPETDRSSLPPNQDLGKTISLTVCGYGTYDRKDGTVLNQGLLIDRDSLKEIGLSDGRTLDDATKNETAHITISINPGRNDNGRPVARAVDTAKCDFHSVEPFKVEAVITAFKGNEPCFFIENNEKDMEKDMEKDNNEEKDSLANLSTKDYESRNFDSMDDFKEAAGNISEDEEDIDAADLADLEDSMDFDGIIDETLETYQEQEEPKEQGVETEPQNNDVEQKENSTEIPVDNDGKESPVDNDSELDKADADEKDDNDDNNDFGNDWGGDGVD